MIIDPAELKRRHLLRIAGIRDNKAYIGPEIITLELTDVCNLRCHFCYAEHSPGNPDHFKKANFFPWKKFLGIVRDCVDLNVDQISIVGNGEPTMHPLFWDMMHHLEQQPLKIKFFTNATFSLDHCSDVIKADHVIINLSAVDRQHFHELQGKDLFGRVIANIKRLVSLRDAGKPGFHIEIAYIVNSVNINQKQKMQDLASQLGVNSLNFRKMRVHNRYSQDIALPDSPIADSEDDEERNPLAYLNGWFYVLVTSDGKFHNCYRTRQMDSDSFKQFWFSPDMMKIRLLGKFGKIRGINTNALNNVT